MSSNRNDSTRESRDLHRIAALSAYVRGVEEQTRGVGITALNAMLASNSSGGGAVGFRVASIELRRFAALLDEILTSLLERISGLVRDTAERMRQGRVRRLLGCAAGLHGCAASSLGPALREIDDQSLQQQAKLESDELALRGVAARGLRQCDTGLSLSRSAMIEAAYGGDQAVAFRHVADQLVLSIDAMKSLLLQLHAGLAGGHA
jgi:hypothetical protein